MVIGHKSIGQLCKQLFSAIDLGFFDGAQIQAFHCTLCFGNEVNMLHCAFMEYDCPVRRIVPNWRRNKETSGQLCIDEHFVCAIKAFGKLAFHTLFGRAVGKDIDSTKTCDRIAEENGVSKDTVIRASRYMKGVEIAEELIPGLKQNILSGRTKVSKADMRTFSAPCARSQSRQNAARKSSFRVGAGILPSVRSSSSCSVRHCSAYSLSPQSVTSVWR